MTSVDSDTRPRPATGGPPVIQLDLDNRISSTGTETKAHNVQTGTVFNMDFQKMQQEANYNSLLGQFQKQLHMSSQSTQSSKPVKVQKLASK